MWILWPTQTKMYADTSNKNDLNFNPTLTNWGWVSFNLSSSSHLAGHPKSSLSKTKKFKILSDYFKVYYMATSRTLKDFFKTCYHRTNTRLVKGKFWTTQRILKDFFVIRGIFKTFRYYLKNNSRLFQIFFRAGLILKLQ